MKIMSVEEIKAMIGTEFKYILGDHAEINAVVAAFDLKIGFTCLATELIDSTGDDLSNDVDENGNLCLVGLSAKKYSKKSLKIQTSIYLRSIKHLGYYMVGSSGGFGNNLGGGDAICSF